MAHVSSSPWRTLAAVTALTGCLLLAGDSGSRNESRATEASPVLAERDTAAANRLLQGQASPFVPNLGQWDCPAHFVHRSGSMTVCLEDRGWLLNLVEHPRTGESRRVARQRTDPRAAMQKAETRPIRGAAVRMTFDSTVVGTGPMGEAKLPGVHNFFLGNDESRWRTHVPLYASVLYRDLYPGIDIRMREARGHPEYDLLLDPGACLARVSVRIEGAERLSLASDGSLVVETALGPMTQPVPRTWEAGPLGQKREISCRYVLLGSDRFGFEVADWSGTSHLTIDPGLLWSTFLGGSSNGGELADDVFVDGSGVVTVVGGTDDPTFPTTPGAYDSTFQSLGAKVFISQLDPSKTGSAQLLYSTFLGGLFTDFGVGVSVDTSGVVTVFGRTGSPNFPTTPGAFSATIGGHFDVFVSRLDPSQTGSAQLLYSTYLGGQTLDQPYDFCVDAGGVVTVVGFTGSFDFPTTPGAINRTRRGINDVFVSQLDPSKAGAAQLIYSTLMGGFFGERATGVSVDERGVITVAGETCSPEFPTTPGAYDRSLTRGRDAFISRLDPSRTGSSQLPYSTFLGGRGSLGESAMGLSVDASGVVTLGGWTTSADFPTTPGAYDSTHNGRMDAFVARLDPSGAGSAQLLYSTFLGGSGDENAGGPFVNSSGVVTVFGFTDSSDWPSTLGAFDTTYNGGPLDAHVSRLDPSRVGSAQLLYSTFLGGSGREYWDLVPPTPAVDSEGTATITGSTESSRFPTTPGAYDTTFDFPNDAFVTRLDMLPTGVSTYGASSPGCTGPLAMSVSSWPQAGNAAFSLTCNNAPPSSLGAVLLGASALTTPFPFLGVDLWVDPAGSFFLALPTASNPVGAGDFVLPLPLGTGGGQLAAQFVWFGPSSPAPCPPGAFSASNALAITIQP